jgi:hypothetical protein
MTPKEQSPLHRLLLAAGCALLLLSIVCNLTFAWRSVTLQRQIISAVNKLAQVNQAAQQTNTQISLIAQDLAGLSGLFPWLVPILQKYGVVRGTAPAPPAPAAAASAKKN